MRPFGLAASLPSHYGYGSVHDSRRGMLTVPTRTCIRDRGIPGTIKLFSPPTSGPFICAFFAQYGIGPPVEENSIAQSQVARSQERAFVQGLRRDTTSHRLEYFGECLSNLEEELSLKNEIKKIIFPAGIGWRGIPDAHWALQYKPLLNKFAEHLGDAREVILLSLDNSIFTKKRQYVR